MERECLGAQGEITIFRINKLPENLVTSTEGKTDSGDWIISHSESGHHHILSDCDSVLERVSSNGIKSLYALLDTPGKLFQDAANPHDTHNLPAGIYEFRIAREFDPFTEQAKRVAD
jgi:hypothetical protein